MPKPANQSQEQKSQEEESLVRTIHDRSNPYVINNSHTIRNTKLSAMARFLLVYCFSFRDDWEFSPKSIAKGMGIGRDKVYKLIRELVSKNHALRIDLSRKSDNGRFQCRKCKYVFFEKALSPEEMLETCDKYIDIYSDRFKITFLNPETQDPGDQDVLSNNKSKSYVYKSSSNMTPPAPQGEHYPIQLKKPKKTRPLEKPKPLPDKPKTLPDKVKIGKPEKILDSMSEEERQALIYNFGADLVREKEANLAKHLRDCQDSKYWRMSRAEAVKEWCQVDMHKRAKRKNVGGKGAMDETMQRQNREIEEVEAKKEAHRNFVMRKLDDLCKKNRVLLKQRIMFQSPTSCDVQFLFKDGSITQRSAYDPDIQRVMDEWSKDYA